MPTSTPSRHALRGARSPRRRPHCFGSALALLTLAAVPSSALAGMTVVATGIDNPRGLALAADGTLYVAAAGTGGNQGCMTDEEGKTCFGPTGKVLSFKNGVRTVVAKGLLSAADETGAFATGPDAVSVGPDGRVETIITSGTKRQVKAAPKSFRNQAGALLGVAPGPLTTVAQVSPYEWANNVDGVKNDRNSNPYGVLALDGHTLVADAGANAIFDVRGGVVSLFAVIPKVGKAEPVPTSLALAPDGGIYVGELALGAGPGKASVIKIPAGGGAPMVFATGFTAISGLATAPDGSLYVTELSLDIAKGKPGAVIKIAPDGTRTALGGKAMMFPAGAAADGTGVYVSLFSTLPSKTPKKSPFGGAGGQIVKLTP